MALRLGAVSLGIGLDSMLLVHWLLGTSRCQDPILRRIVAQALLALGGIPLWRVWHVYRRHNKRSDFMANYAMDQLASWATSSPLTSPPTSRCLSVAAPALTTACAGGLKAGGQHGMRRRTQ